MDTVHAGQFLGLPPRALEEAEAVVLPLPFERTVSCGRGTGRAPAAVLEASCQVEFFDEEALVDFEQGPPLHTAAPLRLYGALPGCLEAVREFVARAGGKFVLALGGEHTVTYGVVTGLAQSPDELTIVQVDAHADLRDELDGLRWSHGTVMRRLCERGFRIIQVGVRSLARAEYEFLRSEEKVRTFYACELPGVWQEAMETLRSLTGDLYLTVDVDGLDPCVLPSTGTPEPGGLSWQQTMELIRTAASAPNCRFVGADIVEFVPSPIAPGCDVAAAGLAAKVLAFWARGRRAAGGNV